MATKKRTKPVLTLAQLSEWRDKEAKAYNARAAMKRAHRELAAARKAAASIKVLEKKLEKATKICILREKAVKADKKKAKAGTLPLGVKLWQTPYWMGKRVTKANAPVTKTAPSESPTVKNGDN